MGSFLAVLAVMVDTRFSLARQLGDFGLKISSILRRNDCGCCCFFCFSSILGDGEGSLLCEERCVRECWGPLQWYWRVVEEEMAAAAAAMRVREVRIRLPHFGGTSNSQQSYRGTVGVL
jgi:hypothetical protein